jgi:hypothetical protein
MPEINLESIRGCPSASLEPNASEHLFQKDPDLWWRLCRFPQDNRFHFSGNVSQVTDKNGTTGWQFILSTKIAWPMVKRPPYPPKTWPPGG